MGYCIWKINRLIFLQHFVFQKLFHGWVYCDYPDHDEATAVPNSKDATLTILVSEADTTAYHEETIAESHDTLQSELEEVYKKKPGER